MYLGKLIKSPLKRFKGHMFYLINSNFHYLAKFSWKFGSIDDIAERGGRLFDNFSQPARMLLAASFRVGRNLMIPGNHCGLRPSRLAPDVKPEEVARLHLVLPVC